MFKIFSKSAPDPVLDRTFGCSEARSLRKNFQAGKFAVVEKQLQRNADTDQRSFYFDVLAELQDRPPQFDQWIENHPQSAQARLASGAHALDWAWQARGYVRSEDVSDSEWEQFHARPGNRRLPSGDRNRSGRVAASFQLFYLFVPKVVWLA
jgi:hypothetical protein